MKHLYSDGEETIAADTMNHAFDWALAELDTETEMKDWRQVPDEDDFEIVLDGGSVTRKAREWAALEPVTNLVSSTNY